MVDLADLITRQLVLILHQAIPAAISAHIQEELTHVFGDNMVSNEASLGSLVVPISFMLRQRMVACMCKQSN